MVALKRWRPNGSIQINTSFISPKVWLSMIDKKADVFCVNIRLLPVAAFADPHIRLLPSSSYEHIVLNK